MRRVGLRGGWWMVCFVCWVLFFWGDDLRKSWTKALTKGDMQGFRDPHN